MSKHFEQTRYKQLYHSLVDNSPFGYAYHEIMVNEKGEPVDYRFLEANQAFENLTGLCVQDILGQRVTEVLPGIRDGDFDWVAFYGKVALEGKSEVFEQYSAPLNKWYKVHAWYSEKGFFITSFVDITKEIDRKLELESFFELSVDPLCIVDTSWKFVKVNKAWEKMLGRNKKALEQRPFMDVIHPDDVEATRNAFEELKQRKKLDGFVNRIVGRDGSCRYLEWHANLNGYLVYLTSRDITDRLEAEHLLEKTRKQYASVLNTQKEMICRFRTDTTLTFVNQAYCRAFGKTREELLGMPFLDLVPESAHRSIRKHVKNVEEKREPVTYSHKSYSKGGTSRWHEWTDYMITEPGDPNPELQSVGFDITEKKEAEEQLKKAYMQQEALLAKIPAVIYTVEIINGTHQITYVNEKVRELLGYEPEDFIGNFDLWKECVHPDDAEKVYYAVTKLNQEGRVSLPEYRFKDKSGTYHWLHDEQRLLDQEDGRQVIIGACWDLTERKEADKQLEREISFQEILIDIAATFINLDTDKVDDAINKSLKNIGRFVNADRAYIFEYDFDDNTTSNTHEWCKEGIASKLENLQKNPIDAIPQWVEVHSQGLPFFVPDVLTLENKGEGGLRSMLEPQDIKSLITFPIRDAEELMGFVGFDSVRQHHVYSEMEKKLLHMFSLMLLHITKRIRIEQKLHENQQRLSLAQSFAGIGAFEYDLATSHIYWSTECEVLFGLEKGAFDGSFEDFLKRVHPDDRSFVTQANESIVTDKKGVPLNYEHRILHSDGSVRHVREIAGIAENKAGAATRIVGFMMDITRQKREAEALENEEKLRQIVDNIDQTFWLWSHDLKEIVYGKSAFEILFGVSSDVFSSDPETFYQMIHPDDRSRVREAHRKSLSTGISHQEYRISDQVEEYKWIEQKLFPVKNEHGVIIRYASLAQDITERKEVELTIRSAKEKAEESDRLKSAFLATISHELRTPLTWIIGFSNLIRSRAHNEQDREQAAIIYDSGKEFLAMMEDIFDLALVEGGRVKIRNQTFNLLDLHESAKNTLEELLTELGKAGQVKALFRPDKELMGKAITCDRIKIIQVLTNLLRNAVKFTDKGSIELGYYSEKADQLTFYVKDTGVGIPEEKRDMLFDFFRQVDESDTRKYGGLGIGLAISKRIAEALKGFLSVESKPGEGSVFYFTVPVLFPESVNTAKHEDNPQAAPAGKGKTILVVDDYENMRTLVKLALEGTDICIIEAENGREAVAQFENNPDIDLILMDLKMPIMDGFTATQTIKEMRPDAKIIAVTAYSNESDKRKAMEAGCDEVISKPFDIAHLISTINTCLDDE